MLQNKRANLIISLIIALVLWAYVIAEINPTITQKFTNVPIQFLNAETLSTQGLAISGELPATAEVMVEGRRTDLISMRKNEILITVNFSGCGLGENQIPLQVSLPDGIKLKDVKERALIISLEERTSAYKPVKIIMEGTIPEGMEPGALKIQPEQTEITGGKSFVSKVDRVEAILPVEKLNEENKTLILTMNPVDKLGNVVKWVVLSPQKVQVETKLLSTKTVPLSVPIIGEVGSAYEITDMTIPSQITIKGSAEAIKSIDDLSAEPVDISKVKTSSSLPVNIKLPKDVELADSSKDSSVQINIKGIKTVDFEVPTSDIAFHGLSDIYTAHTNLTNVHIIASGKESVINQLKPEDFSLSVEVTGLDDGIYTLALQASSEKQLDRIVMSPKEISVYITEKN